MVLAPEVVPEHRPDGLRLVSMDVAWHRIDRATHDAWTWTPFPFQRNRFDCPRWRVRYAAHTERGAFRERFADRGRRIRTMDREARVVRLHGRLRVVDLRQERSLDLLCVDGEIGTGRSVRALRTCSVVATRLLDWYGGRLHGIVYTSRTTPQTSADLAFFEHSPLLVTDLGRLDSREQLLTDLVADDGFRVDLPGWI